MIPFNTSLLEVKRCVFKDCNSTFLSNGNRESEQIPHPIKTENKRAENRGSLNRADMQLEICFDQWLWYASFRGSFRGLETTGKLYHMEYNTPWENFKVKSIASWEDEQSVSPEFQEICAVLDHSNMKRRLESPLNDSLWHD